MTVPCPQRRYEWFIAGTEPTVVDRSHVKIAIDARTGIAADASTPPQYIQPQMIWQLPPEYAAWARENELPQLAQMRTRQGDTGTQGRGAQADMPLLAQEGVEQRTNELTNPPLHPVFSTPPLSLTSPDPNRVYTRDPGLPASAQQVPLTALPGSELAAAAAPVTLLTDGVPFAIVDAPDYTAWWPLTAGQHTFLAVATRADGSQIASEPVTVLVE